MNRKIVTLFVLLCTLPMSLKAAEIDQLTNRERYHDLAKDFTETLNAYTNDKISIAVDNFNLLYSDEDISREEIHKFMAFEIYKATAGEEHDKYNRTIPSRVNLFYALGKSGRGPIQEWIESEENSQLWTKVDANNIYDDIFPDSLNKNYIVKVGGEFIGPDKIDHFFDQGYSYWLISDFGENEEKALEFGVESEFGWYGLKAGGIFSFADLKANWDGYQFYRSLFDPETNFLRLTLSGRVEIVRPFDWSDYVDWEYDELKNPCILTKLNMKRILRHIEDNYDQYITTYYFLKSRDFFDCIDNREDYYTTENIEFDPSVYFDLRNVMSQWIESGDHS